MGEEQKQDNTKAEPEANDPSSEQPKNPSDDCSKNEAAAENKEAPNSNGEEKKDQAPPPPPEEIIMRVFMHCVGCARKVQRCLRACDGVEDVLTDCRSHKVVVKGKVAAADPLKVVERLQRKTGRKVELLTPLPPKPEEKEEKVEVEPPKPEEKKEEPPVIYVVLKVHMHCEACSMEIKKRILKMKGVQSVEADLKASEVAVTGDIEAPALVDYVYKRTGKHAAVVKQEVVEKKQEEAEKGKEEEKKDGEGDTKADNSDKDRDGDGNGDRGEAGGDGGEVQCEDAVVAAMAAKAMEMRRNEMYCYYYYPKYQVEHAYPPQIFSDENPNACSVM